MIWADLTYSQLNPTLTKVLDFLRLVLAKCQSPRKLYKQGATGTKTEKMSQGAAFWMDLKDKTKFCISKNQDL